MSHPILYTSRWWVFLLLALWLAACGDEPAPDVGDPIPNVREGLIALYSGDLGGVDRYFCDQIVLSARRQANDAARSDGSIDLEDVSFEVVARQAEQNWTVAMRGLYTVSAFGVVEQRNTATMGEVLIGVEVEDDMWKICAFGSGERPAGPLPAE